MPFTGRMKVETTGNFTKAGDFNTAGLPADFSWYADLINGTAAGAADLFYADNLILTASETRDLDLAGGLTDIYGATIQFRRIRCVAFRAPSTNTGSVQIGGAGTNDWRGPFTGSAHGINVSPGGGGLLGNPSGTAPGWVVTPGTVDILRIVNNVAAGQQLDLVLIGCSA